MTALTLSTDAPSLRPRISGLLAERVFVQRSLRHSLRDGESLLMAIMLPVMLMLLFTWVFGGAIDPSPFVASDGTALRVPRCMWPAT